MKDHRCTVCRTFVRVYFPPQHRHRLRSCTRTSMFTLTDVVREITHFRICSMFGACALSLLQQQQRRRRRRRRCRRASRPNATLAMREVHSTFGVVSTGSWTAPRVATNAVAEQLLSWTTTTTTTTSPICWLCAVLPSVLMRHHKVRYNLARISFRHPRFRFGPHSCVPYAFRMCRYCP